MGVSFFVSGGCTRETGTAEDEDGGSEASSEDRGQEGRGSTVSWKRVRPERRTTCESVTGES